MSDTMSLEMRVTAHDDASPVIRKIMAEVRRLQDTVRKSFASPARKLDLGLDSIKSAAANQRTESYRTAVTVMRDLSRVSAFQARMRRQAARESDNARRADAAGQADAIRDLRDRMRLGSRMAAQKLREEKDVARETAETRRSEAAAQAEALRSLRERMSFASRMTRQRVSEVRDNARLDARRTRERDRADRSREREHERDRNDFTGRARDAGHRVSDAYTRSTRAAAGVGAAGAFGTGALVKRSLGAEISFDDAEIATRQYGGLSKSQARALRDDWAAPLSEQLGVETGKLLSAWVDATKLGIPASGAKDFAQLTTKTSEAWEVGFDKVKDTLGTVNSILTSDGSAFDIDRLKSVSNTLQHLAAKQSTTPEKLIEFLSQGAGASQILGASQEAGLAFGSASTSLGNKAGESGRLYDYIASRIVEMPRLTQKKGDDGKFSKQLMQDLGYGTAENMDSIRRSNPDAFLPDLMDRFSKIKDPKKQEESIRWFSGREWMGEFGRMVKGAETYREAEKLRQEAKGLDAIGEVWETHKEKLSFVFKQFKAGWLNILGEFGKELSPLARQAGDFFLGWTKELRSGGLAARFKAALQGAIEGLGFKDLPGLLEGIFGKPGEGGAGSVESWKAAARGFADGIRSVGSAIKQGFSAFAGANASPETIARLTGQIIALAGACVVIAPVVGVIGSIATALGALALAATSAWRLISGAGIVGGAAAGAGAAGTGASATAGAAAGGIASRLGLAGAGTALMSGIGLAIVAEIGANRGTIATSILTAIKEFVTGLVPTIVNGIKEAISALVAEVKSKFTIENIKNELVPAPLKRWMDGPTKEQPKDTPAQPGQPVAPNAAGPTRAYASGGYVSGPGGPRSDSISAWLSNGEFVMNADAVKRFRPYLEAMNGGNIPDSFFGGPRSGEISKFLTAGSSFARPLGGIKMDPSGGIAQSEVFGGRVQGQIGALIREIRELIAELRHGRRKGDDDGDEGDGRKSLRERERTSETAREIRKAITRSEDTGIIKAFASKGLIDAVRGQLPSSGSFGSGVTPRDNSGVGGILGARPGERLGQGTLGRRGIIGGQGINRDGLRPNGMPDPSTGAGVGPYKGLLDHIARSEGTAHRAGGGYNTSLDYGRWLPGGQEQNLAGMTLDQIDALQTGMLQNPENRRKYGNGLGSSALGRYQIVRKTLRGLRQKLGLNGSEKFDQAMQDRLAAELARQRGPNGSLGQEWASLRGGKLGQAIDLARQIPRGASTVPGARPGITSGDVVGNSGSDSTSGAGPAAVGERIRGLMRSGAISNAQCVALAKAYVGVTGSVTGWRRGEAAEAGTLKPGTPVATFLNRDGSQSDRYDGGAGVGKEGNKTTHAAVFQDYIYKNGKIVGMNVIEQFRGSGGPRMKRYMFNNGKFGTDNGSNYHAVKEEKGGYLGGKNNPMAQVGEAATKAAEATKEAAKSAAGTVAERFGSIPKVGDLVNRMNPDKAKELVGQGLLSEGFRKHRLDDALGGQRDLMQNLPFRSSPDDLAGGVRDQAVAKGEDRRALREGAAGGKSMTVSAPITIQGVSSPEAVANKAARHVQDSTLWRTHDMDFASV